MADGNGTPKPRVIWLAFASLRSHENQDVFARGLSRLLVHDLNRAEPGVAAAALLTARRGDTKGFVLPQVPSEPGPLAAFGEQFGARWVVQGFSSVTPEEVDLQVQWVDAKKQQVSAVTRFSGKRDDLPSLLDQIRKAAGIGFEVPPSPVTPPPVWQQTRNHAALQAFLRYLDNAMLLFDPADRGFVGELRDPTDYLGEALRQDKGFRAAVDALAAENRGDLNSFGPVLEIAVSEAALM